MNPKVNVCNFSSKSTTVKDALTCQCSTPNQLGQQSKYLAFLSGQSQVKTVPKDTIKGERKLQSNFRSLWSKFSQQTCGQPKSKCPKNFGSFTKKFGLQKLGFSMSKQVKMSSQTWSTTAQTKSLCRKSEMPFFPSHV